MPESGSCCQCCCSFIFTLGLTALFLWLSLRASNPKCSIQSFYLPALNKSLYAYQSNTTTTSNSTLYFYLRLDNPNKDKGIHYDALNLTFYYQPPNATNTTTTYNNTNNFQFIGNETFHGFKQGHKKKAKRIDSIEPKGINWEAVFRAVSSNKTAVFRVELATKVRFHILFWNTKRHKINVGANVEVNDQGTKVNKKAIKLKSGAPPQNCYRALMVGVLVMIFSFYILNF